MMICALFCVLVAMYFSHKSEKREKERAQRVVSPQLLVVLKGTPNTKRAKQSACNGGRFCVLCGAFCSVVLQKIYDFSKNSVVFFS